MSDIDWSTATVKVLVLVHHTATSEWQEIEFPLSALLERLSRLEAALGRAGDQTMTDRETLTGFPPVPQGVFGVCAGCGAVAWELLEGLSPLCMGCDSTAYQRDDGWNEDEEDWDHA